jgi:hypothetical protein
VNLTLWLHSSGAVKFFGKGGDRSIQKLTLQTGRSEFLKRTGAPLAGHWNPVVLPP